MRKPTNPVKHERTVHQNNRHQKSLELIVRLNLKEGIDIFDTTYKVQPRAAHSWNELSSEKCEQKNFV